jgi:hypothetical protein
MIITVALILLAGALLVWWYRHEEVLEGVATVHLQSEHEHFHLHVDLPDHMDVQPGDTLRIESVPELPDGRTDEGEMSYESRVMLRKASWLQRNLIRHSSLVEVTELIEH